MDEEKISVSNIPVSFLEPYPKNSNLSGNELFLVSQPVFSSDGGKVGYISKALRYDTLASNVSGSLDISGIEARIEKLSDDFNVNETLNYLKDKNDSAYEVPTVISALRENNRGQIVSVSGYVLSDGISSVLSNIVLPKISATESPWVRTTQITSLTGYSPILVASQKLASDIYNTLTNDYVLTSKITHDIGNVSENLVASQKLAYDISSNIQQNFVKKSQVKSTIDNASIADVASQSLANGLSNTVVAKYLPLTDVVDVLGPATNKAASQSLINDLSVHVSNNYLRSGTQGNFVRTSQVRSVVGNSTTDVASQSLAQDLSDTVEAFYTEVQSKIPIGLSGEVFYLSPNGDVVNQTIMNLDVFVCESDADIVASKNYVVSLRDVFTTWNKGGTFNGTWYGYTPNYVGGNSSIGYRSGLSAWVYNSSNSSIEQPVNTTDYSFYTSILKYNKYDVKVRCYSTDSDNDYNGLVAAFAEDSSGKPHTLSFLRKLSNKDYEDSVWTCRIDACYDTQSFPSRNSTLLSIDNTELLKSQDGVDITDKGWNAVGGGTIIHIIREYDILSAITSKFSTTKSTLVEYNPSKYVVNLSSMEVEGEKGSNFNALKGTLDAFRGSAAIGFSTMSQPNSFYDIIQWNVPKIIIDSRNNQISSFYKDYPPEVLTGNAMEYVGIGRLTKNIVTNKTYYVSQSGFTKIAEYTA